ncbi:hypothetical protein GH714_010227 [Hevea brasiliensis]|uniref:Disease resistance protein At4g27190-like leucine-rich repeats domain-containing protein n=1 Tax=Hevea brasiliensis TaxID=3981 RepID=A0A6A6N002_HEVBR|nr:hypothetical protein GH714_010227 [Hevea brasiliensis]
MCRFAPFNCYSCKSFKNRDLKEWKVALDELSMVDNKGIQAKVYSALELSCNHLATDELKSFFLLCAQIANGDIQIRELLLYNSDRNGYVKMHDIVRDALSIASKSQHLFTFRDKIESKKWPNRDLRNCSRISLPHCEIHELPERLECPELEFLVLGKEVNIYWKGPPDLKISDLFFEGITKLKVLHFTGMCLWPLPPSLGYLTNLLTLCLDQCELRDPSVICELKKLEILSFRGSNIEQLPREIAHLPGLKLLDLSYCLMLKVIPANVISRLSLEELYMRESFCRWELQGLINSNNASLAELKNLSSLTTLEIDVPHAKMLPKIYSLTYFPKSWKGSFTKLRKLEVGRCNGLKNLFSFSMVRNLSQLQEMRVIDCENLEEIVIDQSGFGEDNVEVAEFSQLRSLELDSLPLLKSFCFKVKASTNEMEDRMKLC